MVVVRVGDSALFRCFAELRLTFVRRSCVVFLLVYAKILNYMISFRVCVYGCCECVAYGDYFVVKFCETA